MLIIYVNTKAENITVVFLTMLNLAILILILLLLFALATAKGAFFACIHGTVSTGSMPRTDAGWESVWFGHQVTYET